MKVKDALAGETLEDQAFSEGLDAGRNGERQRIRAALLRLQQDEPLIGRITVDLVLRFLALDSSSKDSE